MYSRFRQVIWVLLALGLGYAAGSGPFAEWVTDVTHMIELEWAHSRLTRGPNGMLPLLLSGFLIGQGMFLILRRFISRIEPLRAKKTERLAAWDSSLNLPRRFGLNRFLEHCSKWSADDPTTRIQSLALFKIHGLGRMNEENGTHVVTQLLQRVACEVRLASLPDAAPRVVHWLTRYFPQPIISSGHGTPYPRLPARWSGSTFALAFRELDGMQAISITRDLATWIRSELSVTRCKHKPWLSVGIAIGTSNVAPRALTEAALEATGATTDRAVTAAYDPTDLRGEAIAQINGVASMPIPMGRFELPLSTTGDFADGQAALLHWLREWGPALGCFVATFVLLHWSSAGVLTKNYTVWPNSINEVQILDSTGVKTIRLMREVLPSQSMAGWTISDVQLTQGNPTDGPLTPCQIHLSIANNTGHTYYVSALDFSAVDSNGREVAIDAVRMLQIEGGISGRWLSSGETWTGWLYFPRRDAAVQELVFNPDRFTRLRLQSSSS